MNNSHGDIALDLANNTNVSIFLTGRAGTGKSTLLKQIIKECGKNIAVLAPTGIAALNVQGMTIHSFFQLPHRTLLIRDEGIKAFWINSEKRKLIESLDTIIIDEVSMVRADLMDAIDYSLRLNSNYPHLPFGGKQMIFVGDLFQLEPITNAKSEKEYIKNTYQYPYFFQANALKDFEFTTIELNQVFRQKDTKFVNLLDKIRAGSFNTNDLQVLNTRVHEPPPQGVLTLTTKVDMAERINENYLSRLDTQSKSYEAVITGDFDNVVNPTDRILNLKVGSQVMFVKNDKEGRWVNGTLGKIHEFTDSIIYVELNEGNIYQVEREIWDNVKYLFNPDTQKVETQRIGTYKQFPLKLAWAITIHKSQGMTFDKLAVDFGTGTFANGQAYVALSRVRSFEGLYLTKAIHARDIQIDKSLKSLSNRLSSVNLTNGSKDAKHEYNLLQTQNVIEKGNYYIQKALRLAIAKDWKKAYINFKKAFAILPSYSQVIYNATLLELQSKAKISVEESAIFSSNSYAVFVIAVVNFLSQDYNKASNAFMSISGLDQGLVQYFLSRSLLFKQAPTPALNAINRSLEIVPSSRGYFQKAMIFNPYQKQHEEEQLINKSIYVENLLISLNLDSRNLNSYIALLHFIEHEGLQFDLPGEDVYLKNIKKTSLDLQFFQDIKRTLQKNKLKLQSAALPNKEESSKEIHEFEEDESYEDFDISEQELMEDGLDEFFEDDEY